MNKALQPIWRVSMICCMLLLGLCRSHLQAQAIPNRKFYFQQAGVAQGLSDGAINDLMRDRQGRLWLATYNGLNCFDGVHFKTWKVDPNDARALNNPVVQGMCEDADGNIWLTTEIGVSRYDHQRFYNYTMEDAETGEKAILYNWAVQRTHHGEIVASGTGGLFFYDAKADRFVQAIPKGPDGKRLFRGIHKNSMTIDSVRNGIWLGTDKGIAYFDLGTRTYFNYLHNPKGWRVLQPFDVHPIVLDRHGQVVYHDNQHGAIVTWSPETNDSTAVSTLNWADRRQSFATIYFDAQDNMWMSTWAPHAYFREASTGRVFQIDHDARDEYAIASSFFWDVHEDVDGTLYFGTTNGLSTSNPRHSFFSILEFPDDVHHVSNYAQSVFLNADHQGHLWLAPSYDCLLRYDLKTNQFQRFNLFGAPDPKQFDRKRVSCMEATDDLLYFGTTDGLYTYDPRTERFTRDMHLPDSLGLAGNYMLNMKLNRHGELWCYVTDQRLLRYNIQTHAFSIYKHEAADVHSFSKAFLTHTFEDEAGEMWFNCTTDGLLRYDRQHDRFEYMSQMQRAALGQMVACARDSLGDLWTLNTTDGLRHFDSEAGTYVQDFPKGQLSHFSYGGMLLDGDQHLWLRYYNEYSTVNLRDRTVTNFSINHGNANKRYANTFSILPDGRIVCESLDALILFDPTLRKQAALVDPILVNHFTAGDSTILFLDDVELIKLAYWQNYFSFDFGSLDLLKCAERNWQYRLDGFDGDWIDCGDRRTAYYTNVPSGEYSFQVRVKDYQGEWHTVAHPVKLSIAQVFYKTLAFKLGLMALMLVILILWGQSLKRRNRKRDYARAISYFATSLHGSNTTADILWDITDNVITRTDLVDCVIYLVDESGKSLVKVAVYGEKNAEEYGAANPAVIPMGEGVVGMAARTQKAEIVPDTRLYPSYIPSKLQGLSEIAIPIIHDGKTLGVIDAEHPRKNFFKKHHLELLSTIASISSSKIASAQQASEILEKEQRLRDLQTQVSETRQLALRAQMNPHFIFNCLNSINSFILDNDSDTASTYLIKFARLIRLILENSNDKYIPLQSELDALKLYIEMESLRFSTKFSWAIEVDEEVSSHQIMVPPLILQPFVENAIWHGLLHQDTPGALSVRITQAGHTLRCIIEDDGVGRAASARFKENSLNKKQSLGMKLTEERLALMNAQEDKKFALHITDKFGPDGEALGTRVCIEMEI